jgi:hypothetical protein
MIKYILPLTVLALVGCSSAPKQPTAQFCHTYKTVEVKDGDTVGSKTTVSCSDDPIDRITMARTGVAQTCGQFKYWMTLNGRAVEKTAISCKKFDGTWEVVPSVGFQ